MQGKRCAAMMVSPCASPRQSAGQCFGGRWVARGACPLVALLAPVEVLFEPPSLELTALKAAAHIWLEAKAVVQRECHHQRHHGTAKGLA